MKYISIIFIFILFTGITYPQSLSISGKVTDSRLNPLPNVNIIISETGRGAATDVEGYFIIENLLPGEYDLEFSFIGYESQTIKVVLKDKSEKINVVLKELPVKTEQVNLF